MSDQLAQKPELVRVFNADTMKFMGDVNEKDTDKLITTLENEYANVSLDRDGDITVWND